MMSIVWRMGEKAERNIVNHEKLSASKSYLKENELATLIYNVLQR